MPEYFHTVTGACLPEVCSLIDRENIENLFTLVYNLETKGWVCVCFCCVLALVKSSLAVCHIQKEQIENLCGKTRQTQYLARVLVLVWSRSKTFTHKIW